MTSFQQVRWVSLKGTSEIILSFDQQPFTQHLQWATPEPGPQGSVPQAPRCLCITWTLAQMQILVPKAWSGGLRFYIFLSSLGMSSVLPGTTLGERSKTTGALHRARQSLTLSQGNIRGPTGSVILPYAFLCLSCWYFIHEAQTMLTYSSQCSWLSQVFTPCGGC